MKAKRNLTFYLGILFILCGLVILGVYSYFNYLQQRTYENAIREALNKPSLEEEEFNSNSALDTLMEDPIEVFDSDQVVDEVTDYKNVVHIESEGFNVTANVYEGTGKENLRKGLGHYSQTQPLGAKGNCCVAGHSSITYNCLLNGIENVPNFTEVKVWDAEGAEHHYYIVRREIVDPYETWVLNNVFIDKSIFTIITCTNSGKQRLVITCMEMTEEELADYIHDQDTNLINELVNVAVDSVGNFSLYNFLARERS